jgi:hypothetical protein
VPRFVVLRHETPTGYREGPHWDLMLEHEGVLRTWALDHWPVENGCTTATRLADHRLAYLDYEGPISGNRGKVARVTQGTFEWLTPSDGEFACLLQSGQETWRLELVLTDQEDRYDVRVQPR